MPLNHNDLFHESDPRELLEYLQTRLSAHDLSPDEALAMLSTLHEALSAHQADRQTYLKYSEFMESLHQQMPKVYAFVVEAWDQRGGSAGKEAGGELIEADQDEKVQGEIAPSKIENQRTSDESLEEEHEELEGGEAGEETEAEEAGEPSEAGEANEPLDEDQGDSDEQAETERDGVKAESEESDEGESPEAEKEDESEGSDEEGNEEQEEDKPENEAEPVEEGADAGAEEESGESGEEGGEEAGATEGGGGAGHEESEWPEMEEPGPEEPVEGEEGNTPAID